jgi:hypothetical protein
MKTQDGVSDTLVSELQSETCRVLGSLQAPELLPMQWHLVVRQAASAAVRTDAGYLVKSVMVM